MHTVAVLCWCSISMGSIPISLVEFLISNICPTQIKVLIKMCGLDYQINKQINNNYINCLCLQVIQLDISPEVQKQIISELEVLYKVRWPQQMK